MICFIQKIAELLFITFVFAPCTGGTNFFIAKYVDWENLSLKINIDIQPVGKPQGWF